MRGGEIELPDPDDIVGYLENGDEDDGIKVLREAEGYEDLMFHFVGIAVTKMVFKRQAISSFLKEYLQPSMEAFLVLVYWSNYDVWMKEVNPPSAGPPEAVDVSSVSLTSSSSSGSRKGTKKSEKGQANEWTDEAMKVYGRLWKKIKDQRDNNAGNFDKKLLDRFISEAPAGKKSSGAVNRTVVHDIGDDFVF